MDTSRFLFELWKGFLSEFCGVYHLEWFAEFIILPFFWGFVWFVLRRNTSKKKLWLGVGLVLPVLLLVLWINAGTFFERPGKFFITLSPLYDSWSLYAQRPSNPFAGLTNSPTLVFFTSYLLNSFLV